MFTLQSFRLQQKKDIVSLVMNLVHYRSGLKCITILFFLLNIPLATALTFNFSSFSSNNRRDAVYEGSARLANNSIELTPLEAERAGRFTYAQPLHLWDRATGNLTDFTTHFAFVIDSFNSTEYGDGFAFFLSSNTSVFLPNSTGGNLGLTGLSWNSTVNKFVAVEFDIHPNGVEIDAPNEHVGIDIDMPISEANVTWLGARRIIMEGRPQEAWISYDSQSTNLSVAFTGLSNGVANTQRLSYIIDLRDHLPEFVNFGFSASTGAGVLQTINSWSFSSTLDDQTGAAGPTSGDRVPSGKSNSSTGLVIGLAIGGTVLALFICMFVYCIWKNRKQRRKEGDRIFDAIGAELEQNCGPKKFAYKDLKEATNSFSELHKLGEGGFGSVYKGFVKVNDLHIAVKRISSGSKQGIKEFAAEVTIISTLRHKNLVQLLGWCYENKELLLVYEFMPNGSLDDHLFKSKSLLNWGIRFKIVTELADALRYLQEDWEQYIVHRDIKLSNIMLDANFNAKLGDFGLAKLIDHEKAWETTLPSGTRGYMAPEYVLTGKASKETDVYSFGIVVLEIASGRKSRQFSSNGDVINLTEWVWDLYLTEKLIDAADPQLSSDFNKHEMKQLLCVGLWCAHPDRNSRPSIRQVIRVLNFEAPLPVLPVPTEMLSTLYQTDVSTSDTASVKASTSSTLQSTGSVSL